jgi:ribosome modulation factor
VTLPTKDERTKAELYQSYIKGWRDAASIKSMDNRFVNHATRRDLAKAYFDGYNAGYKARREAFDLAALTYEYKPNILRAQEA